MPEENLEALEWPDLISAAERPQTLLNHKVFVRREDFGKGWGNIALLLLELSDRHYLAPEEISKYVFEIEVVD
jgi:hypothetical protein